MGCLSTLGAIGAWQETQLTTRWGEVTPGVIIGVGRGSLMPISRFTSSGHTELEKDADLAIFLVNHLDSLRDAATGSWPGERETRRLQNTCHAVESLYELNLGLISQRLVEPGVKWLIDLPILR